MLIFKGLTVRRLYKSFGVKGLTSALDGSSQVFALAGNEAQYLKILFCVLLMALRRMQSDFAL
jgi:hypothetical protein